MTRDDQPVRGFATAAWIALSGPVLAQAVPNRKPISVAMQATRLVRLLELPARRVASARELLKLGKHAVPALTRALRDPRPDVVGRVAIFLRMLGDDAKSAIPTLRDVAKAKDPNLASAARWALSAFHPEGITLVADYAGHSLIEFDAAGKKVLEIQDLKGIFCAERLPSGNYLIALAGRGLVREIDRKGKVIWEYHQKSMNPLGVTRLPNDHTLISNTSREVLEVDTKGNVIQRMPGVTPWKAQALRNGRVLVADGNAAFELDAKGKKVRSFPGIRHVREARRLANGHTLLADYKAKTVIEVDADGKKVRSIKVDMQVDSAIRTPDGGTITGGAGTVRKFDKDGKPVWTRKVGRAGSVRHY
jgi:hypothetical protein